MTKSSIPLSLFDSDVYTISLILLYIAYAYCEKLAYNIGVFCGDLFVRVFQALSYLC